MEGISGVSEAGKGTAPTGPAIFVKSGRILRRILNPHSLFQFGLLATLFTAWRTLQSPSTMNYFLLESAVAATLGFFLYGRSGEHDVSAHRAAASSAGTSQDRSTPSELSTTYAQERSISAGGIDRIQSMERDQLRSLVEEGRELVGRPQSLGLDVRFYEEALIRARSASSRGKSAKAIRILRQSNSRLHALLGDPAAEDRTVSITSVRRGFAALGIAFFLFVAYGIWVLSRSLYTAPIEFYLAIAGAAGVVAVSAYLCGQFRPMGVLVQIFLLAVLLKFHFFYLNPYVYASDAFYQFGGVLGIATTGYVPGDLGHYTYFPGFSTFSGEGASLLGLPIVLFGAIALVAPLVSVPVSYLIGRRVADSRMGLFAALLTTFSVFGFLTTHYTPALYGFPFLLLAIYSVIQLRAHGEDLWLLVFWLAALAALFSHPINALLLALILLVRFVYFGYRKQPRSARRSTTTPALAYSIALGTYLAYVALVSFDFFVQTLFAPTYSPPLVTAPTEVLQHTTLYVYQTAMAPVGLAVTTFMVGYGVLSTVGIRREEQRFFVLMTVAFMALPAFEIAAENFKTQSSRFLVYLAIPLAFLGAQGIARMARLIRNPRRAAAFVVVLFVALGFFASTTYLTNNDTRFLFSDVPASTTHITQNALAGRGFLALVKPGTTIYMDGSTLDYFEDSNRAPDALTGQYVLPLNQLLTPESGTYVVLDRHFIAYGDPSKGTFYNMERVEALLDQAGANLVFDAGTVQVFFLP
jgi:hypothetical protein